MVLAIATILGTAFAQGIVLQHDEAAPGELDPAKATDYASTVLMSNVYDTLVWADPSGGVSSLLATKWTTSPDKTTYTFTLRQDVKFHDGGTLTADDVVFSYDRDITINQGYAYLFKGWVTSVTAPNAHTVVFKLSKPYAPFLMTLVRLPILSKATVMQHLADGKFGKFGDYGQAWLSTHDAGSGAYEIVSHDSQTLTVMKKFGGYFLPFAENSPDKVRIRYSVDAATVRALTAKGQETLTSQWLPNEVLRALAKNPNIKLMTEGAQGDFLYVLNTQKPPTDDLHFRKAMAYAFNYKALWSILKITDSVSSGAPVSGPLIKEMAPYYDTNLPLPQQNLKLAKQELAKSKYKPDQYTVEIGWVAAVPAEEKYALLLQQNLQQIGIKSKVVKVPWSVMIQRANKVSTTPNVSLTFTSSAFPDPDSLLYDMYDSSAAGTWLSMSWLNNPDIDKLISEARTTLDTSKRAKLYNELQKKIVALQPDIFGFEQVAVMAAQKGLEVPTLKPGKTVAITGGNLIFRLMSVSGQ
jgi:peptide/nickel transport system substrate-binding protein